MKKKMRIPIAKQSNKVMKTKKDYRRKPKYIHTAKTNWLDPDQYWE